MRSSTPKRIFQSVFNASKLHLYSFICHVISKCKWTFFLSSLFVLLLPLLKFTALWVHLLLLKTFHQYHICFSANHFMDFLSISCLNIPTSMVLNTTGSHTWLWLFPIHTTLALNLPPWHNQTHLLVLGPASKYKMVKKRSITWSKPGHQISTLTLSFFILAFTIILSVNIYIHLYIYPFIFI